MAVQTNKRKDIYTCNGTGPYVITFPVEYDVNGDAKNIKAKIDEGADLASDKYTVTGLNVSTVDSYDNTHQITIYRNTPATQDLDYQSGGGAFDLDTLEKQGLDRAVYMIQERLEEIERTLKAPISDPAGALEIPGKTTRASTHLAFDADGNPIASEGIPNVPATAWAATLLDDINLLAAQKTLGLIPAGASGVISAFIQFLLDDASAQEVRDTLNAAGRTVLSHIATRKWTSRTSAADNSWTSVCWSPELGLFVAVAASGTGDRVMTSPDGITWTIRTSAADNDWTSVCWSPAKSLFVAVSTTGTGNRVMTSPDGITWTIRTSAADNNWFSVCWSLELDLFVAIANSGTNDVVMTSPDGITWTIYASVADNSWTSVCWSPELGLFVAVSNSGTGDRVLTSL